VLCCCTRFRIPRTKQEIDADFRRKQLSKRFKQELKRIRNSELDVMDLRRGIKNVCDFLRKPIFHLRIKFDSTGQSQSRLSFRHGKLLQSVWCLFFVESWRCRIAGWSQPSRFEWYLYLFNNIRTLKYYIWFSLKITMSLSSGWRCKWLNCAWPDRHLQNSVAILKSERWFIFNAFLFCFFKILHVSTLIL
jgi:hypothetical protein